MGRTSRWETVGEALLGDRKNGRAQDPFPSVPLHFADDEETVICRCQSSEHRHNKLIGNEGLLWKATAYFRKHPDKYQCTPKGSWREGSRPQRSDNILPRLSYSDAEIILAKTVFDANIEKGVSRQAALQQTSDYMYDKCGKRLAPADILIFVHPLNPADFHDFKPSDRVVDELNPCDRVRGTRDALPSASRSETAPSGRRGRSYTDNSSSSQRDRSKGQYSLGSYQRPRNSLTWETETLPKSGKRNTAPSSRHGRTRSDYSSSSRRGDRSHRHSPQPREHLNSRATHSQSESAGTGPGSSFWFASSHQSESVRAQLHDQRWKPNDANYRQSRREPTEIPDQLQHEGQQDRLRSAHAIPSSIEHAMNSSTQARVDHLETIDRQTQRYRTPEPEPGPASARHRATESRQSMDEANEAKLLYMQMVLNVFPDISLDYLLEFIKQKIMSKAEVEVHATTTIEWLLSLDSYPREVSGVDATETTKASFQSRQSAQKWTLSSSGLIFHCVPNEAMDWPPPKPHSGRNDVQHGPRSAPSAPSYETGNSEAQNHATKSHTTVP